MAVTDGSPAPDQNSTPADFGYTQYQQPDSGANPWGSMMGADSMAVDAGTTQANNNIGQLNSQMKNYSGDASAYPAMANAFSLGNTGQAIAGSASNPSYGAQPLTTTMPDSGSRGFNPWSLQGESNARGK